MSPASSARCSVWPALRPGATAFEQAASAITIPVEFVFQWDDEVAPRETGIALFDAFASKEKTMHINPGGHMGHPQFRRRQLAGLLCAPSGQDRRGGAQGRLTPVSDRIDGLKTPGACCACMERIVTTIAIARQFRGPPHSGNGGYVCGLLSREIDGPSKAVLRAIIPLDAPLTIVREGSRVSLMNGASEPIAFADPAGADELPAPPVPPSLAGAHAAQARFPFFENPFHPPCFTCSVLREEGDGLRIFTGQIAGAAPGHLAGVWTPHPSFASADGTVPAEIVWAALDCPGSVAWIVKQGNGGGLLGTMTGEILRLPKSGETTIVTAWPIVNEGTEILLWRGALHTGRRSAGARSPDLDRAAPRAKAT